MAKQLQKKFELWSTQKYSKVSKICSAGAEIFFRVSYMFKPIVHRVEEFRFADMRDSLNYPSCAATILEFFNLLN